MIWGEDLRDILARYHKEFIETDPLYPLRGIQYIYFAQSLDGATVKIGKSSEVHQRINQLGQFLPGGFRIIGLLKGRDEFMMHLKFNHLRIKPKGETFMYSDEITNFLEETMTTQERDLVKLLNTLVS